MSDLLKIVIIGAGGFGKEVLSLINDCNKVKNEFDVLGFVDDDITLQNKIINDIPVLGDINWLLSSNDSSIGCILAIGEPKIRKEIFEKIRHKNFKFPKIIHPLSYISQFTSIDDGTVVQAGAKISCNIKIGKFVYVNFNSVIGHDCDLDDFVTLCPSCNINGENIIEEGTFFGSGAVTRDKLKIGKWSHIGACSVITKHIPENTLFFAAPGTSKNF
tara:strand:+ start:151 stop:801 length:651 start_codon:yes stop_codon:yes gene_type:complete